MLNGDGRRLHKYYISDDLLVTDERINIDYKSVVGLSSFVTCFD